MAVPLKDQKRENRGGKGVFGRFKGLFVALDHKGIRQKIEAITTKNTQYLGDKKIKKPDIVFLIFICYNGIQLPTCGGKGKRHD